MKKYIIGLGLTIMAGTVLAGKLEKAFEALDVFDYFKAKELFEKVKEKEIVGAPYGLSLIYGRSDNPFYHLDSAYKYILQADTNWVKLTEKEKSDLNELKVDSIQIENWKDSIDAKVFRVIQQKQSVSMYQKYIEQHGDSDFKVEALKQRNSLAFKAAKQENTSSAFRFFMTTYPEAEQFYEAKNLFDLALYKELTQSGKIGDFQAFVKSYPESPYNKEAQDSIYYKSTPNQNMKEYHDFILANPKNRKVEEAWRNIYKLYMVDYSPERIVEFRIDFPDYPFTEELLSDMKLSLKPFLPYKQDGLYGFIDTNAQVMIPAQFESVDSFQSGLALAVKNGKIGYINKQGKTVIPFMYEDGEGFQKGVAVVMKNDFYGLIDKTNKAIVPFKYELVGKMSSGKALVANDTAYGYVNEKGNVFIPLTLEYGDDFEGDFALITLEGKKGIINENGKTVIPCNYSWLENFNQFGLARAKKDSLFGLLDKNGSEIVPFEYDQIGDFSDSLAMIVRENKYGYINTKGEIVIPIQFDFKVEALLFGKFNQGYAKFHLMEKFGIIDAKGEKVFPAIFQDIGKYRAEGFTAVKKRGKWGYSNPSLNLVIPYQFDYCLSFNHKVGIVKKDNQWGIIKENGKYLLDAKYDDVKWIGDSLYVLSKEKKKALYIVGDKSELLFNWDVITSFDNRFLILENEKQLIYYDLKRKSYLETE